MNSNQRINLRSFGIYLFKFDEDIHYMKTVNFHYVFLVTILTVE